MFLNYMWQNMRVAGAPPSMGQDEEMDTTPLAQPFFIIDKEKGTDRGDEDKRDEDDSEGGGEEEEEEDDDDDEVSVSKKASTYNGRVENGKTTKTNGNHLSDSEESSEEEDLEEDTTVKVVKRLPVSSTPQCQTSTS